MAKKSQTTLRPATGYDQYKWGHLHLIDKLPQGDPAIGAALSTYTNQVDKNRQSKHWVRAVQWIENILFSAGRHYVDDILVSRLTRDSNSGDLSVINEAARNVPRPVNDILGRYVETNIALLTENRPRPRVSAKTSTAEDEDAAELSELTLEYLWEALKMPELHREIARIILHCGVCWLEICWDPTQPRRMTVPQTQESPRSFIPGVEGLPPIQVPVPTTTTQYDERGRPVYTDKVEYGDIVSRVVSPFEMHLPVAHWWSGDSVNWVMREEYVSKIELIDKYSAGPRRMNLNKKDGWYLDRLEDVGTVNVKDLPMWWWERLADLVEGPGPSLYVGTPEQWEGYTVVRTFDRKPSAEWPRGRTIIVAGDQVIYDSPKERGARAYDPRWPTRWHPYIRFRWEGMVGNIYGRSLVSKLLPKLKRVNAIDTTLIMWRRTVPISTWISPKGAHPVEDLWFGKPGQIWEYDPRRTAGKAPEPVLAPDYPQAAIEERNQQLAEMEAIAGTEEVLRGQRPVGVNSAAMLDVLRKQALASRSAILQAWDESLQEEGTALLQEVIKHIRDDPRYAERIRILAREKASRLSIQSFSGIDISDNVVVRVDTASQALVSKEAKEAKALEFMQYAPGFMALPINLRQSLVEELGFGRSLTPQGPDVQRAKRMISWIKQQQFDRVFPMVEDDPYVFYEIFVKELKSEAFFDLNENQQLMIIAMIDKYKEQIRMREQQMLKLQQLTGGNMPPAGGGQQ